MSSESSITYYGYTDNEEFLTRAPVGTVIRFNSETTMWVKERYDDYWMSGSMELPSANYFADSRAWKIKVEAWNDENIRTPEQNARIVAKLEELMETAVDQIKNGDTPSDEDVLWMGMILDCIEEGEKG